MQGGFVKEEFRTGANKSLDHGVIDNGVIKLSHRVFIFQSTGKGIGIGARTKQRGAGSSPELIHQLHYQGPKSGPDGLGRAQTTAHSKGQAQGYYGQCSYPFENKNRPRFLFLFNFTPCAVNCEAFPSDSDLNSTLRLMARGKAKVDAGMSSVTGDPLARKNAGPTKFKVYSERGKLKTDAAADSLRKSVAATKGTTQPGLTIGPKNMEKIKGLRDSSVKTNVRRKALADVSNIRKIGSSGVACDGSKPITYSNMDCWRLLVVSDVDMKELVASSNAQSTKTKETCGGSTFTDNRKILPVLRRNNQENSDSSDKGKGKTAIAIKAKSGKKMLPQLSNTGSHIAKNRPSDGHIMTVPKGQRNIATHASSGIPTTRTGNIARVVPNIQTTIKTKHLPAADKSSSVPAVSSGTDKPETNPVPEDIAST
ncbi:hypothetical protein CRG98_009696, partial [Punica granatum]